VKAGPKRAHRALTRGDNGHDGRDAIVGECPVLKPQPFLANLHLHLPLEGEGKSAQTGTPCSWPPTHPGLHRPVQHARQQGETGHPLPPSARCCPRHLQDEDEVVNRAVALVEVMFRCLLVLSVVLELLDDIGVFQEPQQDLLGKVGGLERLHF